MYVYIYTLQQHVEKSEGLWVGMWAQPPMYVRYTQFTCFTGTKVKILTQLWQKTCSQPSPATNTA